MGENLARSHCSARKATETASKGAGLSLLPTRHRSVSPDMGTVVFGLSPLSCFSDRPCGSPRAGENGCWPSHRPSSLETEPGLPSCKKLTRTRVKISLDCSPVVLVLLY